MDAREFAEWLAYSRLQPFGYARADQHAGTIAAAMVNIHRKKSQKPLTWRSFFPEYKGAGKERLHWADLLDKVTAINAQLGGTDKRRNR